MSLWRPKLDPFFKDILNKPGISVEPDIFLGNLDQLLVNVDANHPRGFVVLRNADGYVADVAANVKNLPLLKPVAPQVLETSILDLPWVPETNTMMSSESQLN